jgi:hypothetical protein
MASGTHTRGDAQALSKDDVFEVFSNQRRRLVFDYLHRQDENNTVDISEISTHVASAELETPPERIKYDERKNVHTALHQFHLPKMDAAGIVEFDDRSGDITLTEEGKELDVYLETVSGDEIPWATYFVLLSGTMVAAILMAWLQIYPFTTFTDLEWAGIVSVASLVSSVAYLYSNRYEMRLGAGDGSHREE